MVDHFRGRIQFVQVGSLGHYHPELEGVIDLRGKTELRQLIRLVYRAQGVVTPVSLLMHLAAAVFTEEEIRGSRFKVQGSRFESCSSRPCVVIAGGREPPHWEAYPTHQFIHTVGMLPCCRTGGCWRSRALPLGDGDEKDDPKHLCVDVVGKLPRCMDMITADEVIRRIELYLEGAKVQSTVGNGEAVERTLTEAEEISNRLVTPPERIEAQEEGRLTRNNARAKSEEFLKDLRPYPGGFAGRGIVLCGGGAKYFPGVWVCVNMLRRLGCALPIQIWYLGEKEIDGKMRSLLAGIRPAVVPLTSALSPTGGEGARRADEDVGQPATPASAATIECVDATEVRKRHPARILNGWELKPYAILRCPFKEVLYLDADNVPVVNPEFLFDTPQFAKHGAVFWPDYGRLDPGRSIWEICGVPYRDEPEFESGQILINKEVCWKPLQLAMWYNEHSDFFYHHIHGDKETFHMAWRKLGQPYAMPSRAIQPLAKVVMCQHDFEGRRIFQHRNLDKWSLLGDNQRIPGFLFEEECRDYLSDLRAVWSDRLHVDLAGSIPEGRQAAEMLLGRRLYYRRVGFDRREMGFQPNGRIGVGSARCEAFWDVKAQNGQVYLEISSAENLTCRLKRDPDGAWRGCWERFERMPVEITTEVNIQAVMISCAERDAVREETLRNLAKTDWGRDPVHVQMDDGQVADKRERQLRTTCLALKRFLAGKADYVLFFEDDLLFNQHLLLNLNAWGPLRRREVTLAGLYNPNLGVLERREREHAFVADPGTIYGSQAFLFSRRTVEYCLAHWDEMPGGQDIRLSRLAARLAEPIFYHSPSLVQHMTVPSVWGGCAHQAVDFDAVWCAPA